MPNIEVKNSSTGTMGTKASKRTRYEKMETGYGKIPAAAYAVGDTLFFSGFPSKELVYARFVSNGESLDIFHGADLSSAVDFDIINDGDPADISYVFHYKKGTGNVKTSADETGDGILLRLTIASSAPIP